MNTFNTTGKVEATYPQILVTPFRWLFRFAWNFFNCDQVELVFWVWLLHWWVTSFAGSALWGQIIFTVAISIGVATVCGTAFNIARSGESPADSVAGVHT